MFRRALSSIGLLVIVFSSAVPSASAWRMSRTVYRAGSASSRSVVSQRGRARPSLRSSASRTVFSSSSSSFSSSLSSNRDPDTDASLRGRIVMLGAVSPVLGALNVLSNAEPLIATRFTVVLTSAVTSVDHLQLFDHDGRVIGAARLDSSLSGNATYVLNLRTRDLQIERREDYGFYVRAKLKAKDQGGVAGETLQISSATVNGDGAWSNRSYSQTATGTFSVHETARSAITSVVNAGLIEEGIIGGSDREIGRFRFSGKRADSGADVRLTQLTFTISQVGGVTLSSAQITADGSSERVDCTLGASTVSCTLPASFGSLTSSDRTLTLFAGVSVPSNVSRASLQLSLNQAGDPTSAGAISWTDGTDTYNWVGLESPVARGTYYSY